MPRPDEPVGPFPIGVDAITYDALRRRVLWSLPTGLYLIGSGYGDERNLMTASHVIQLASAPKLIGAAIETKAVTLDLIRKSGCFSLSLLHRDDRAVVRGFVKRPVHDLSAKTLGGEAYNDTPVTGAPVLASALSYLDCALYCEQELGSHVLVVGEVVDAHLEDQVVGHGRFDILRMEDTRMSYGG